jgi:hypothetical protein
MRKMIWVLAAMVGLMLTLTLAGCGGAADRTPADKKIDKAAMDKEFEEDAPAAPKGGSIAEEEAKYDEAKAAAAQKELTLEDMKTLDGSDDYEVRLVGGLLNCQTQKYIDENGQAAWNKFSAEYIDRVAEQKVDEVVSMQETLMREGYSCTVPESMAASGQ